MNQKPFAKVMPEPTPTGNANRRIVEGELEIDMQDTGATLVVTILRGGPLTPQAKRKLVNRYPNAIIIDTC